MKDNIRFPAGGNFDFNVGRTAAAGAAQGASAAAKAGEAAASSAAQPITDGLTLSGAANTSQANIFAPTAPTKNNAAAETLSEGLAGIADLGLAQGQDITKKENVGAFLAAAR